MDAITKNLHKESLCSIFFIFCFFVLFLLGTNGTITRSQQRGSLNFFFFFFFGCFWAQVGAIAKLQQRRSFSSPFFSFPLTLLFFFSSLLFPICFLVLVRKFVLFCFVVFATLVNENLEKKQRFLEKRNRRQLNWQMAWEVS